MKSIYEKSSDLSGTIVYSKYPGMSSPSRNLVSSGPDNENCESCYSKIIEWNGTACKLKYLDETLCKILAFIKQ